MERTRSHGRWPAETASSVGRILGAAKETYRVYHADRMAIHAVLMHELRAGGFDHEGLFVVSEHMHGREALALGGAVSLAAKARVTGDLTPLAARSH